MLYKCVTGDRIDLIVLKHYGGLDHLNAVVAENIHLCKLPLSLKNGTVVELPEFSVIVQQDETVTARVEKREALW